MVFFTCNNCGESVKKPSVEKHYNTRCRNSTVNVSCMDCQKDFHGEEYVAHVKCISEAEKYSGKGYVAKENKNSGQKKQETWTDIVRSILATQEYQLTAQTRNIFQRLQSFDNVPRKKAKFQNFVSNCMRIPVHQAEPVWNILEKELQNMKQKKQEEVAAAKAAIVASKTANVAEVNGLKRKPEEETNGKQEVTKKKKKKDQEVTEANGNVEAILGEDNSFEWCAILEKIVAKKKAGINLDKLKNKVLKKYKSKLALEELTAKQQKKFEKKFTKALKKCPAIQVNDNMAQAC